MSKLVVIRVRGQVRVPVDVTHTLLSLKLARTNSFTIVEDTPAIKGMLQNVVSFVTWGELNEETHKKLTDRVKKEGKNKVVCLQPPRKGYGRKGIKVPFAKGGALGYRAEKINDLVERML